jgi:hypothetical protein
LQARAKSINRCATSGASGTGGGPFDIEGAPASEGRFVFYPTCTPPDPQVLDEIHNPQSTIRNPQLQA